MKILVMGAGVLGSQLAHVLNTAGHEVTLLARGSRKEELLRDGLVIRHYAQLRTTRERMRVTSSLQPEDAYDIVFVVLRCNQLAEVLPLIAGSRASDTFVILGNNPAAPETLRAIQQLSLSPKAVLFGFISAGGRREKGRVVSIHSGWGTDGGKLTVGSLDGDASAYPLLTQAFSGTKFRLEFNRDIDAWLKCHLAFVLPVCFAVYASGGDLRKIAGNKVFINKVIDAIDEAYQMLLACGVPLEPPDSLDYVRNQRAKCYRLLQVMAATPLGRLAASDHAMNAKDEMHTLYEGFCRFKERAGIPSPAWDELEQVMNDLPERRL